MSHMYSGPEQLKDWMERRGFNYTEAAEYLGLKLPTLSQIMNGHRTPDVTNCVKIYRLSGVPVDAWTEDELSVYAERRPARGRK